MFLNIRNIPPASAVKTMETTVIITNNEFIANEPLISSALCEKTGIPDGEKRRSINIIIIDSPA